MAAFACYVSLFPSLNAPSRLVPLQFTKPTHTPNLFSLVSSRLDMDLLLLHVPEKAQEQLPTIPLISCS